MKIISVEDREKILAMCSYISDDNGIADYMGVPVDVVRTIRAKPIRNKGRPPFALKPDDEGQLAPLKPVTTSAAMGSKNLLSAIVCYMRKYHPGSQVARLEI